MNTFLLHSGVAANRQPRPACRSFNEGGGFSQRTQETYLYRAKKIIEYFNKLQTKKYVSIFFT